MLIFSLFIQQYFARRRQNTNLLRQDLFILHNLKLRKRIICAKINRNPSFFLLLEIIWIQAVNSNIFVISAVDHERKTLYDWPCAVFIIEQAFNGRNTFVIKFKTKQTKSAKSCKSTKEECTCIKSTFFTMLSKDKLRSNLSELV